METVKIQSSYDGKMQNAYFYPSSAGEKKPLIVSLHPWSFDYTYVKDHSSLAKMVEEENWNFIYPDFRGPNNSPESCLSEAVIMDIDDAIAYAIKNANVDEKKIVVTGVSGGGMATLGVYMRSSYELSLCMAWCPISDLEAWYHQSKYAESKYWHDILQVTSSDDTFNIEEARKRSPLFTYPVSHSKNTKIELYSGINDGYTGSVPILHTILFYNKIAKHWGAKKVDLVLDNDIISLLSRSIKECECNEYIGDRKVLYEKCFKNIKMVIFNGGHEILSAYTFSRIKQICLS